MSDPESWELALPLDSKWALLKPNLEPQRETTPLCILLGCSLASSWAQGHSLVSREMGFLSSQPSIWTTCLNSAPLANAALHPALLLPAALHGLHSTRQLCFHRQAQAGEAPGPLQRMPSPLSVSPRLQVPHSGLAGSVSCHSALCGRSWRGQMPGQPTAGQGT